MCEFVFYLDCIALLFQIYCEHMERSHLNIGKVKHCGSKSPSSNAQITLLGGTKWKFSQFHIKSNIFNLKTIQTLCMILSNKFLFNIYDVRSMSARIDFLFLPHQRCHDEGQSCHQCRNSLSECYINSCFITIFTQFFR